MKTIEATISNPCARIDGRCGPNCTGTHLPSLPNEDSRPHTMPETPKTESIRLSVDIPKDLHLQFRILCMQRNENMKDVMLDLLTDYLKRAEKQSRK